MSAPVEQRVARTAAGGDANLVRVIGLAGATMLVIGNALGSGIFLTSGVMVAHMPSAALLLVAWALGGVIVLAGGLTFAELGAMHPRSGGLYVFLEEAYGPLWGFLYGWTGLLVVLTGAIAAVAIGFAEYVSFFFPSLSTTRTVLTLPLPWMALNISAGQIVGVLSIVVLGAVNYVGVSEGNNLQAFLTFLKVGLVAALVALALAIHPVTPTFSPVVPPGPGVAGAFGLAMVAVMWTYEGWYYVALAGGEIKNPQRNVPLSLVVGILLLIVLYIAANLAYLFALPMSEIQGTVRIGERAVTALVGPTGGALVSAAVVLSAFGCNAAAIIPVSRVCYAMASDGLFFKSAARVHPVYRTPHVAIVLTCAWSALLTLTGTYEQLFTYATFASLLFGIAAGLAVFSLRRKQPDVPRPYRVWGYPVTPLVFALGSAALVVSTLYGAPTESILGLGLVALGLPAYWWWNRKKG